MGIVADAIVQAIRAGAPIYNKGDVGEQTCLPHQLQRFGTLS